MAVELALTPKVLVLNPAEVRDYLASHPDMVELVERVCDDAVVRFGARGQVLLELYCDPEIDDEYLTVLVRQARYEKGLLQEFRELMAAHDAEVSRCSGWLIITTDFRPPVQA